MYKTKHFLVRTCPPDDCFCVQTENGIKVVKIKAIHVFNTETHFECKVFDVIGPFFENPICSSDIGIVTAEDLNPGVTNVEIAQILYKYMSLPMNAGKFLMIPLLHIFQ